MTSKRLSNGSSVQVSGKWKPSVAGSEQHSELIADHVRMLGEANPAVCSPLNLRIDAMVDELLDLSNPEKVPNA